MKETDRAMKEVHKFLQENVTENMSMDEINALLQAHLKEINANIPKGITEETAETADDFMELAHRIQSKYGLETEDRSKLQRAFE